MNWEEVKELGPFYAIGALDEETARAVEEFLRQATPDQQQEFTEWREVGSAMTLALPTPPAPQQIKGQLMKRIGQIEAAKSTAAPPNVLPMTTPRRRESPVTRWLLAAATVLLTFATGYLLWLNLRLIGERNQLADELDKVKSEVGRFISPATRVVSLAGEEAPQASAKLVWDTTRQTWVIYVYHLPQPPSDQDYQLWYVTSDAKISAAVFRPDNQGSYKLELTLPPEIVSGIAATAVTLEPKGGSHQPTGKFYLKGAI